MSTNHTNQLTQEDYRALSALFYLHINPYGSFELDLTKRLFRIVPFPHNFRETLMLFINTTRDNDNIYLFELNRKKPFTTSGIKKILAHYTTEAGIQQSISPHKLRHFLFTWLKKQGIDDALIQPYSGHETMQSLEIYSKLSLSEAQDAYDKVIEKFPL